MIYLKLILKWLVNPWTWVALLALALAATGSLYRHERAKVLQVQQACDERAQKALQAALREQASAWESIYSAQQEAVARMAQEAGVAAANAREWKRRYDAAKQTPACKQWAEAAVLCPVE